MQRTKVHTTVEKFMSMILRHSPETIGVQMSKDGWVSVDEIIFKTNMLNTFNNLILTRDLLNEVVLLSPKKRFVYSEDKLSIRANQGHSIEDIQIQFLEVKNMDVLYHGSTIKNRESIQEKGLLKMGRNFVHLSHSIEIANHVGRRYGKLLLFEIDMKRMLLDGFKLYKSENDVYLIDFVHPKYLKII